MLFRSVYQISPGTGNLALAAFPQISLSGANPVGIAADPLGNVVVAYANGSADVLQRGTTAGSPFLSVGLASQSIAIPPPATGQIPGTLTSVAIDPATELVYFTYSYPAPTGQNPQAGGVLAYVLTTITGTPTLSELAASPFVALAEPTDIVIAGGFAYLTDFGANFLSQYSLASATLSPLSPSGQPSGAGPMSVAVTTSYH